MQDMPEGALRREVGPAIAIEGNSLTMKPLPLRSLPEKGEISRMPRPPYWLNLLLHSRLRTEIPRALGLGANLLAVLAVLVGTAQLALAQVVGLLPDAIERTDVMAVERDGRDLFAFDGLSGLRSVIRLEVKEEVLFERTRGQVGLVLTNRRALGVAVGTGWRQLRLRLQETPATVGLVEDRIALVVTDRRALAFSGPGGWVDEKFSPNEVASALRAGASAAVVTTNRRALGIGSNQPRFVSEDFRVREELESVTTRDTMITLRTDRRILVFSAPRANWSVQQRNIN